MDRKPLLMTLLLPIVLSAGCTWVEPTEEGYQVTLAEPATVTSCQSLGTATAEVPDSIGPFPRREEKVKEELRILGKNEAASLGGDTVVEVGPAFQGRQQFRVYRCNS